MRRIGYPNLERAGRLGNSMWEIASTLGLARARGVEPVFPESYSYRPYFSMPEHWFDDRALARATPAPTVSGMPKAQANYLQSWRLIAPVMDEIRAVFAPSRDACELVIDHLRDTGQTYLLEMTDAVTLHVRRGDNTDPESHPIGSWPLVTLDYYRAALEAFDPDLPVVVFSDDPLWVIDHMSDLVGPRDGRCVHSGPLRSPDYEPAAYAADPAMDWIDLQLMAMFSGGHILANSTYGLWGALLGPAPTTYPNNWVGWRVRESLPPEHTMVPPEWIMIDNPVPSEHLHP